MAGRRRRGRQRARKGAGSIYVRRLPNGQVRDYRARISIPGEGRPRERRFLTRQEAEDWLDLQAAERAEITAGCAPRPKARNPDITYSQLIPELLAWLSAGVDKVRSRTTVTGYRKELAALERWWGPRVVRLTTPRLLEEYIAEIRRAGRASSTIRNRLDRLSQLHQLAVRNEHLAHVPCEVTRPEAVLASEPDAASETEFSGWLERVKRHVVPDSAPRHRREQARVDRLRARAVMLLAGDAGLRPSEIAGRLWSEIELYPEGREDGSWGRIRMPVYDEEHRPKHGISRSVPIMTPELAQALDALPRAGDLVVGIRTSSGLTQLLTRVLGRNPQLYRLRHRFGTVVADSGEPIPRLMQWMGHRRMETTQGYLHLDAEPSPGASEALQRRADKGPLRGPKGRGRRGLRALTPADNDS
jgi:site-specific recombinase XerD